MSRTVIVDGSNVAFEEQSNGGKPKVSNLVRVRKLLEDRGLHPIVIVDASLYHKIDDQDQLNAMFEKKLLHRAPAGTDADYWVLKLAEDEDALVVSNDRFQPYQMQFPWIEHRRVPLMIVEGNVHLYEPALEAYPHLVVVNDAPEKLPPTPLSA